MLCYRVLCSFSGPFSPCPWSLTSLIGFSFLHSILIMLEWWPLQKEICALSVESAVAWATHSSDSARNKAGIPSESEVEYLKWTRGDLIGNVHIITILFFKKREDWIRLSDRNRFCTAIAQTNVGTLQFQNRLGSAKMGCNPCDLLMSWEGLIGRNVGLS